MEEMRVKFTIRCSDKTKEIVKWLAIRAGESKQLVLSNQSAVWVRWRAEFTISTALSLDPKRAVLVLGEQEMLTIKALQMTGQAVTIILMDQEKRVIGSLDVTVKRRRLFWTDGETQPLLRSRWIEAMGHNHCFLNSRSRSWAFLSIRDSPQRPERLAEFRRTQGLIDFGWSTRPPKNERLPNAALVFQECRCLTMIDQ
jgi:hypothetical protein